MAKEKQSIIQVNIEDIHKNKSNPRNINDDKFKKLVQSIKDFPEMLSIRPIVVDKEMTILGGNMRYEACKKAGLKQIFIIKADDLTEEQKKEFIIKDNVGFGEWDWDMLANEWDTEELEDWGLDVPDMLIDEEETIGDDEAPEIPEDPETVLGDLWELGDHRLLCGDSTEITAVDKLMDGQKADMVFTDPPYGVDYKGINNDDRGGLEELLKGAFANYKLTTKGGGSIYCFHSDRCADIFHLIFREFFHFSSMIIWNKNSLTLSQTDYQSKHEPCLYGWMEGDSHSWYSDRKQVSVWDIEKQHVKGHTTPKPVEIVKRATENSSKKGDIVSDYFGGSGSTLVGCEKTNRLARLMELDPKYCDVIVKRYIDFCRKNNRPFTVKLNGEEYKGGLLNE